MGGNDVQHVPTFGVDVGQLRELMDTKGMESVNRIDQQFGGIDGLCSALHTSPNEGKVTKRVKFWLLKSVEMHV